MTTHRTPLRRSPLLLLAGLLTRTAGPPALARAVPPLVALGIAAAIVFAGNGMRAADLVAVSRTSLGARLVLWAAWLLLAMPAARALLETPTTFVFRALPVPPWHFFLVHGAHLLVLQTPWMVLFTRAAGPVTGLAAGLGAVALASLWIAGPRDRLVVAAAASMIGALGLGATGLALLPVAAGAAAIGVSRAWAGAPERSARRGAALVGGGPLQALVRAHLAVLVRRDAVALLRGAVAALAGGLVFAFAFRNNGPADRGSAEALALVAGALPLSLATGGIGVRVLETERRLTWLLLTTATSARARGLAAAITTAVWGAAAGALYGAVAAAGIRAGLGTRLGVLGLGAALGAGLAAAAAYWSRRAEQSAQIDGTGVVVGMIVSAGAVMVGASTLGPVVIAAVLAVALALAAATPRLLRARERRTDPGLSVRAEDA